NAEEDVRLDAGDGVDIDAALQGLARLHGSGGLANLVLQQDTATGIAIADLVHQESNVCHRRSPSVDHKCLTLVTRPWPGPCQESGGGESCFHRDGYVLTYRPSSGRYVTILLRSACGGPGAHSGSRGSLNNTGSLMLPCPACGNPSAVGFAGFRLEAVSSGGNSTSVSRYSRT